MKQPFPIATSRYQAHALIKESGLAPIRITLGKPRMYLPYQLAGDIPMLAPTSTEFRIEDEAQFADAFRARLDRIGVDAVAKALTRTHDATGGTGLVLLCFENLIGGEWCHRRIAAEWITQHLRIDVPELEGPR